MSGLVDVVVLSIIVGFAAIGAALGLARAALCFAGLGLGGAMTTHLVVPLLRSWSAPAPLRLAAAVVILIVLCLAGFSCGWLLHRAIRNRNTSMSLRRADRVLGAAIGGLVAVVSCWAVGTALLAYPNAELNSALTASRTLGAIDRVVPAQATATLHSAQSALTQRGVPQFIGGWSAVPGEEIPLPPETAVLTPAVARSLASVVRVYGVAPACQMGFTGSGYVSAPQHVTTNAHVVAAMITPKVQVPGSSTPLPAVPVLFDPSLDVAVLYVPGLTASPLNVGEPARPGDPGVMAGYPGGGPRKASPARVQALLTDQLALGTDIYGNAGIIRELLVIAGVIAPGNSGGPFLTPSGQVAGLVSAEGTRRADSAFALSPTQYTAVTGPAQAATSAVSTGPCPLQ